MKLFKLATVITALFAVSIASAADWFIDVRTPQEYSADHIDGTINIIHTNIIKGVKDKGIKNDDNIYVFCRSGKRAGIAESALKSEGYNSVTNLGGISEAREWFKNNKITPNSK